MESKLLTKLKGREGEREMGRRGEWEKMALVRRELADGNLQGMVLSNHYHFRSTFDFIKSINDGTFPDVAMMTFHPQRWTDNPVLWTKELVWQNMKNVVKLFFTFYLDIKSYLVQKKIVFKKNF